MRPAKNESGGGLTRAQLGWLVAASVGLGGLFLALVLGTTGVAHLAGTGDVVEGPPDAAFSVLTEERGDGVAANVTHRGGHAVHPERLLIDVDGERRGNWSGLGGTGPGLVAEGHSLSLTDVEPGDEVRVLWLSEDESETVVLDRGTVRNPDGTLPRGE